VVPGRDDAEPYVEAIIEDVTDRVRLEEQFQQAQRMEAIGRLAGGIAHDFNNLLTVIMTTTELLMSWQPGDPPPTGELDEVYRAARRGADLTRQLLAFGRRQVLAMRPLSVGALVLDMEGMLRRLLGEDVQLRVVASAEPDIVRADQSQLEQVLMNLVVNARDAMPEGGQIVVETGPVELAQGEMAGHPAMAPGAYVRIAVSDTGTGIPPDAMEHLFEPFFTTKPKDKGTGLGLATVYGIVKQLGGYVWPYSEPGQGTTFKIFLPRVDDAAPAAHAEPARREDQRGHQTILVAEDESAIRALLERVLRSRGYDVIAAASGEDALRAVADRRGPIHLLVSDVVMPGMSGPQLAARLAELHPEAVPLFLSGYTDEAVLRLGVAAGRVAFLQKPFTHEEFLVKVRELLENGESTTR
ncbi:MAG: response regulator, partial [Gemmatimonadota bacterium]|nr:response regulator [Gemmatimonadota bacterium]